MTITSDEKDRALLLARLPAPTYVDADDGETLTVCARCLTEQAEPDGYLCRSCILGGEDAGDGASEGVQGV